MASASGDEAAGDGGGARAAVGLDHVAVHPRPCARRACRDRSRRAARGRRAAGSPASGRSGRGSPRCMRVLVERGSMPYSAVTQPCPCPLRKGGTFSSTEAVQMTLRRAELDEHRALRVQQVVAGERRWARSWSGGASVGARHRERASRDRRRRRRAPAGPSALVLDEPGEDRARDLVAILRVLEAALFPWDSSRSRSRSGSPASRRRPARRSPPASRRGWECASDWVIESWTTSARREDSRWNSDWARSHRIAFTMSDLARPRGRPASRAGPTLFSSAATWRAALSVASDDRK